MTNTKIIKANQSWFHIPLHEIWEYRNLLWNLTRRDLTAIYKQSVLGPLWFIIAPLATTIVFTVIFSKVAKISTDGLPPFLFYHETFAQPAKNCQNRAYRRGKSASLSVQSDMTYMSTKKVPKI